MTVKSNSDRQKDYTKRQREAGLVIYRQWVSEEEKLFLASILERMRTNEENNLPALHNLN